MTIHDERHNCHKLLFRITTEGFEVYCAKCDAPVLIPFEAMLIYVATALGRQAQAARDAVAAE